MPNYRNETNEFDAELMNETEKAWLFDIGDEEYWIPKSIGQWNPSARDPSSGTIELPNWFAEDKGIT